MALWAHAALSVAFGGVGIGHLVEMLAGSVKDRCWGELVRDFCDQGCRCSRRPSKMGNECSSGGFLGESWGIRTFPQNFLSRKGWLDSFGRTNFEFWEKLERIVFS